MSVNVISVDRVSYQYQLILLLNIGYRNNRLIWLSVQHYIQAVQYMVATCYLDHKKKFRGSPFAKFFPANFAIAGFCQTFYHSSLSYMHVNVRWYICTCVRTYSRTSII